MAGSMTEDLGRNRAEVERALVGRVCSFVFEVGKISILSGPIGRRQEREGRGQFLRGKGREGWDSEPWVWREGGTSHTLTAGGDLERPVGMQAQQRCGGLCLLPVA